MKLADDPARDYRTLVKDGYDRCARDYNAARTRESADYLIPLIERLEPGARVLDLGCGAGVPIARTLARTFYVTGIDVSASQVELARAQVPDATFIQGDMASYEFPPESFDAAVSFYAVFHLPREEHPALFQRIHDWLNPGGYLLVTLARHSEPAYTEDGFFGVEMYWSNYGLNDYERMITECGFRLLEHRTLAHGYLAEYHKPEWHPLLFAQKL